MSWQDRLAHADEIRARNPEIVLCGYQMTTSETTTPSPGHDVLRRCHAEIRSVVQGLGGWFCWQGNDAPGWVGHG